MIHVLLTPADLLDVADRLPNSQIVILDVLRATSTIVTALHHGAKDIYLFDTLDAARAARQSSKFPPPVLLAGEEKCLKPADFDLGNSPREHLTEKIGGSTILLATTNGTRAATRTRAGGTNTLFAAALLNASATAEALLAKIDSTDTFLLCAGTNNKLALEDVIGAGAILFALLQSTYRADLPFTDTAWLAYHTFSAVKPRLNAALRLGIGIFNIIDAGLEDDIDHCAKLDAFPLVATIDPGTLTVTKT